MNQYRGSHADPSLERRSGLEDQLPEQDHQALSVSWANDKEQFDCWSFVLSGETQKVNENDKIRF